MRPNREYSEAMRLVASDAEREPAWHTYARYCRERGRGLRKQSLRHLETFVAEAEQLAVWAPSFLCGLPLCAPRAAGLDALRLDALPTHEPASQADIGRH